MRPLRRAEALTVLLLGLGLCGPGFYAHAAAAELPPPSGPATVATAAPSSPAQSAAPASSPAGATPPTLLLPSTDLSAAEFYNAANAYARAGRTALAVLYYERARVLAPRDPDLRANLSRVRQAAGLPVSIESGFQRAGRFANPNSIYWMGMAGLLLAGVCLLVRRQSARFRGVLALGAVIGCAAVAASLWNAAAMMSVLSDSIALEQAPASVSPVSGADPLFQVPAAATVRVLDRHGAFELIRDSQGREGWVAAADFEPVIPDTGPG